MATTCADARTLEQGLQSRPVFSAEAQMCLTGLAGKRGRSPLEAAGSSSPVLPLFSDESFGSAGSSCSVSVMRASSGHRSAIRNGSRGVAVACVHLSHGGPSSPRPVAAWAARGGGSGMRVGSGARGRQERLLCGLHLCRDLLTGEGRASLLGWVLFWCPRWVPLEGGRI